MATGKTDTYADLVNHLRSQPTVTDLFKLANSETFRSIAHALAPEQLTALRQEYRDAQTALDGKVRLDTFDGQVINIVGCEWWHSDQFEDEASGRSGNGVTLHFRPERDTGHKFKALTSSAPIVRFCNRFANNIPTEQTAVRVLVKLEPVSDPQRAAQGQRRWTIKQLPSPQAAPSSSPF